LIIRNRGQCGGSGMFIPDPDFYRSRIPDLGSRIPAPKTAMKDIGEKKIFIIPFFGVINFTKLNCFIFEMLKKKIWANFQRLIELFTQKLSLSYQKYGFGIRDPEKTYSGSRIQGSKRPRNRIRNTARGTGAEDEIGDLAWRLSLLSWMRVAWA
jgi:hypothetical protein